VPELCDKVGAHARTSFFFLAPLTNRILNANRYRRLLKRRKCKSPIKASQRRDFVLIVHRVEIRGDSINEMRSEMRIRLPPNPEFQRGKGKHKKKKKKKRNQRKEKKRAQFRKSRWNFSIPLPKRRGSSTPTSCHAD